jgi:hypothetical protein
MKKWNKDAFTSWKLVNITMMRFACGWRRSRFPVMRSAVPGPTWGDLLREFSRLSSDGTRGIALDALRESLFINFGGAVAMHSVVDTQSDAMASGSDLIQVRFAKGSRHPPLMF